jgi:DNA-binding GntR family transcriptional regulator
MRVEDTNYSLSASSAKIERELLPDRVAEALRADILRGRLRLGQRLKEKELASRFGVSHNVVREAFHMLQGEGLIVTDAFRGRSVFNLNHTGAMDLLVIRTSLEALAAMFAAERLNEAKAEAIREAQLRLRSLRSMDWAEWAAADLAFHETIWQAAENEWLANKVRQVCVPFHAVAAEKILDPDFSQEVLRQALPEYEASMHVRGHGRLADSVLGRDPVAARAAMIQHLMHAPYCFELRRRIFQL